MGRTTDTREKVFEAADGILKEGGKPTQQNVRDRIGVGSISTINSALNDWWASLADRLYPEADALVPEPVIRAAEQVWNQALAYTEQRFVEKSNQLQESFDEERSAKQALISELQNRNDYLLDENRKLVLKLTSQSSHDDEHVRQVEALDAQLFKEVRLKEALELELKQLKIENEYLNQSSRWLSDDNSLTKIKEKDLEIRRLSEESKKLRDEVRQLTLDKQALKDQMYALEKEALKQQHRLELVIAQQDTRYESALKSLDECKNELAKK
jgi:outer membrane murein-binding lipoprotein Lpp